MEIKEIYFEIVKKSIEELKISRYFGVNKSYSDLENTINKNIRVSKNNLKPIILSKDRSTILYLTILFDNELSIDNFKLDNLRDVDINRVIDKYYKIKDGKYEIILNGKKSYITRDELSMKVKDKFYLLSFVIDEVKFKEALKNKEERQKIMKLRGLKTEDQNN